MADYFSEYEISIISIHCYYLIHIENSVLFCGIVMWLSHIDAQSYDLISMK